MQRKQNIDMSAAAPPGICLTANIMDQDSPATMHSSITAPCQPQVGSEGLAQGSGGGDGCTEHIPTGKEAGLLKSL